MRNQDPFDENLKQMLESALEQPSPAFQERLVSDVLEEVARQRELDRPQPWWSVFGEWRFAWKNVAFTAATAALFVALGVWLGKGPGRQSAGRVICLYGSVAVQKNGTAQSVTDAMELKSGQRIKTDVGSKAQVVLPDQSQVVPEPRTSLQIAETRQGPKILLEQGTINLIAAKQPPGKAITIQSGHAQVKVLGTRLDVRLVEKPSGARQTRVRVLSGHVEMESGGQRVALPAGTEGVADEDAPPVRASVAFEVNELIRLFEQTRGLAAQTGRRYGQPAIVDLTTGTLWEIIPGNVVQVDTRGAATLNLKYPAFGVRAYTLDGGSIATQGSGDLLRLDLSALPTPSIPEHLILKVPGVGGLLNGTETDGYACQFPAGDTGELTLVQLYLPASAEVENLSPAANTTAIESEKQIITVLADVRLPELNEKGHIWFRDTCAPWCSAPRCSARNFAPLSKAAWLCSSP